MENLILEADDFTASQDVVRCSPSETTCGRIFLILNVKYQWVQIKTVGKNRMVLTRE